AISSVAITDVGKWAYVSDDKTVTTTAAYVPCGVIVAIDGSTACWIDIEPALAMQKQEPHDHSSAAQGGGLTSPEITTAVEDANGNELFKLTATAEAVNELTVANAAADGTPSIVASGSDAAVGILFDSKGAGILTLGSADSKLAFFAAAGATQPAHVADPAACASMTATDPTLDASDITDSTGGTPSGEHTLISLTGGGADAPSDASVIELEANFATIAAEYNGLKDDTEALETSLEAAIDDLAACKTAIDANNAAIDSILAQLATLGLQASS
ncbi:MAG TPA: hypothetical protein VMZ50_14360, partial [Phycisphaerae bacterium]|nr:hypothetical protein [Phycisphaerae bacterium]